MPICSGSGRFPAHVLALVRQGDVAVAAPVHRGVGRVARLVGQEQIELALRPDATHIAHARALFAPLGAESACRPGRGRAIGILDVAEKADHPPLGEPPGQDGQGARVGNQQQIRLRAPPNPGTADASKPMPCAKAGTLAGHDGDVFLDANRSQKEAG